MKQPLVFLHGWGVNSNIWNSILPHLESGFELTLIDLPGYGRDIHYAGQQTLDSMVAAVLDRAPETAHWVGWSLGASIALAAGLTEPSRFLKLQLIAPTPCFLNRNGWDLGVDRDAYHALARDFEEDRENALQKFLLLQVHAPDRSRLRESRTRVREIIRVLDQLDPPSSQTLQGSLKVLGDTDLRRQLNGLTVETQVIAGRNDALVPVAACQYLFDQLPHGHSMNVFETGHIPFLESPPEYIESLTTFLNHTS